MREHEHDVEHDERGQEPREPTHGAEQRARWAQQPASEPRGCPEQEQRRRPPSRTAGAAPCARCTWSPRPRRAPASRTTSHTVATPRQHEATWRRVAAGRPGSVKRGPSRTIAIEYPASSAGDEQPHVGVRHPLRDVGVEGTGMREHRHSRLPSEHVERGEHDDVDARSRRRSRARRTAGRSACPSGGACTTPRRARTSRPPITSSSVTMSPSGISPSRYETRDLDRGDHAEDDHDHHVLERRRVRTLLAGQQAGRRLHRAAELAVRDLRGSPPRCARHRCLRSSAASPGCGTR